MEKDKISFEEIFLFININVVIILLGILLWYIIWIKEYGSSIPYPQFGEETNITYLNTKNFSIIIHQLWIRFREFNQHYITRSIGMESYVYLLFQRKLIGIFFSISVLSLIFAFLNILASNEFGYAGFHEYLLNNKYLNEFSMAIHLTALIFYTFLHFRYFTVLKNELKHLYFNKFDIMSRKKNSDWLSCRTLHISGLAPHQRNSKICLTISESFKNLF
jgi:hypothetical protein